jgi:hypothetical protein
LVIYKKILFKIFFFISIKKKKLLNLNIKFI